jgi:hypothetical protein
MDHIEQAPRDNRMPRSARADSSAAVLTRAAQTLGCRL